MGDVMALNNVISQFRQRNMARNSPIGPGRGGFRGLQFSQPPEPEPEPEPVAAPYVAPAMGGYHGLFGGQDKSVNSRLDFGGNDTIEAPVTAKQGPNDRVSQFYELMEKLRNRESPGLTAYKQALSEVPTADQYKPNWLTRIGAGLAGASAGMKDAGRGVEVAQRLNRSGYENALSDYSNRLGTLKEQATMEEATNRSQMDAVHKAYQMGLDYDKLDLETRRVNRSIQTADKNADANMISAEARRQTALNSARDEWTYTPGVGGIIATNRRDPAKTQLIPGVKTTQEAQLKIAEGQLHVNQGQLGVAQGRLKNDDLMTEANLDNIASQIADRDAGDSAGDYVQPSAMNAARDGVDSEMELEPRWAKFYAKKPGRLWGTTEEQVDASDFEAYPGAWDAYLAERNSRIQKRLRTKR